MKTEIIQKNTVIKRFIILFVVFALLTTAILLVTLGRAWLFTEEVDDVTRIEIDYSVAKLDFDLMSNHMYYYYSDDPAYVSFYTDVLGPLKIAQENFVNVATFEETVIPLLKLAYPEDMIDELDALTYETYNAQATAIYNKYTREVLFPFKIKDVNFEEVDSTYPSTPVI